MDQHGTVYAELGSHMAGAGSPNDPVFWPHHCFVDKIWADWQIKQATQYPAAAPYLPVQGTETGPGYHQRFAPWNTMSAANLIDTSRIRHPEHGQVGYVYR
nr:tyrosinase family protein [Lentzea flava]